MTARPDAPTSPMTANGQALAAMPCSRRLTDDALRLLKMCNDHPSKRMWVWKTRPDYYRPAKELLRKGLITQDGDSEKFRITEAGINVANVQAMAAADTKTSPKETTL